MDRLLSPEKELSPEDIPDLNVKSYYGQDIPAVQDDFGDYSYSDSSTSPETYNGGVSNLSEDSLDNRLISSGLAEESEVPIIESANVYNDGLCDVTNSTGFIDDILGNLGPSVCGGASSGAEADLDREDEANSFSCGESRCSCQGCRDSCKESLTSPLAVSDDSSFTSSCDSFDYPFIQTITEYMDTKLTLSAPDKKFTVPQLVFRFPPMNPNNYSYNKSKEKWKLKEAPIIEFGTVIMTSRELNYKREESKVLLKEFPDDIVFPNKKFSMPHEGYIEGASVSLGSDNSDKLNSLCDDIVSNRSPSSNLMHETSGNIPLMGLLSPAVVPSDTDYTCDANGFNIDCVSPKKSNNKATSELPYSASELSDALRKLESVKYSLESNHSDFTSNNCLKRSVTAILNSLEKRNADASSDLTYDKFKSNLVKNSDSSSVELTNTSNVISVGENVITCKNPVVFSDSYSVKNYDDNGSLKDSNPNSVEEYKHNEDSQDSSVRQAKKEALVSKEIDSDVINDAALLFRLANSFDSFNSQQIKASSLNSSQPLDMPSLSPEPNTTPPKLDKVVPPTLTPQASLKTKEDKQKRKQNKDKISHNVPLKRDVSSKSSDSCRKPSVPELMNFDMTNLKENTDQRGKPSIKSVKVLQKISPEKAEDVSTEKKTVDIKKVEKKNHSVPKSFILGKVFPKNRVAKPDKAPLVEVVPVNGLDSQHDNHDLIKTESVDDTSNNNPDSLKTSDKKSIVVSMVNSKNAMNKDFSKKKDETANIKKSDHVCKSPSFCSKNHKLVVFKKNPSILEKMTKKQINKDSAVEKNSASRMNGFKTEPIVNKTEIVFIDKASENKTIDVKTDSVAAVSDKIILNKEVVLAPRMLSPTKVTPDKSNINESSKNITENVSEKAAYPKSKSSLIRQKTESVVAEADSTGPDTSILEKNISDVIINNRPNLIIQKDSGNNQVGVSNEIHLKQTDSVRLLLDPGHLSHNKITSMVITVATAEISCNINETDRHTIPSISGKPSVTAQIIEQPKKSSKSEKSTSDRLHSGADSDPKSKHSNKSKSASVKKERTNKDRSSSQELLRDEKKVVKSKCGQDSSSPSSSKEVESVSSTSNVVESNRTKNTRAGKIAEEKYDSKKGPKTDKMFNYLDIVTNLRKRSSSCGSTIKGRRYSSETLKHILPIKCSIELDQIKCKTFSLSDTCVSSISDKDSGKNLSVGSTLAKCESIPALKTDRHERVEVSSSTSPGKDERSDGDATPSRDEVNIKKSQSPVSNLKTLNVKSSSKLVKNDSKSNSNGSRNSSNGTVPLKNTKSETSNHHDGTVKATNSDSTKNKQVSKLSDLNESISDRVRSKSSGDLKFKKSDKSNKTSEKAPISRSKSEVGITVTMKAESNKKSKDNNGTKFNVGSKTAIKQAGNNKMSLRENKPIMKPIRKSGTLCQMSVEKSKSDGVKRLNEGLKSQTDSKDDSISSRRSSSGSSSRALSKELRELTKELKDLAKDTTVFNKQEGKIRESDKRKSRKDFTSDKEFKVTFSTPNTRSASHLKGDKLSEVKLKPAADGGSDSNNIGKDAIKSLKKSGDNIIKTNNPVNIELPAHSTRSSGSVDLSDVKPSHKRKGSRSESETDVKNNSKTSSSKKNDNASNATKINQPLPTTRSSSGTATNDKLGKMKISKSESEISRKDVLKDSKVTFEKDKEKNCINQDTVKAVMSSPSTRSSTATLNNSDDKSPEKRKSSRSSSESDLKDVCKDLSKNLSKKLENKEDGSNGNSSLKATISSPNTRSSTGNLSLVSECSSDKRNPRSRKLGSESESKAVVLENTSVTNPKSEEKGQDSNKNKSLNSKLIKSGRYEDKVNCNKNNLVKSIQDKLKTSLAGSVKDSKDHLDNSLQSRVDIMPEDISLSSIKGRKTEVETLALDANMVGKTTLRSGGRVDSVKLDDKNKLQSTTVKTKAALKAFTATLSEDKEKLTKNQVSINKTNNERKENFETFSKDVPNTKVESKSRSCSSKRPNINETSLNNTSSKNIEEIMVDITCPKKKIKIEEHSSKSLDLKLEHNSKNKDAHIKYDVVTSKTSDLYVNERMSLRKHKNSLEDKKDNLGKPKIVNTIPENKMKSERNRNNSRTPQRETNKDLVENKDKERTSLRIKSSQENISANNYNQSTYKKDDCIVSLVSPDYNEKTQMGDVENEDSKKLDWIVPPRNRKGKFIRVKRSRSSPPRVLDIESKPKSDFNFVDVCKNDDKLITPPINRKLRSSSNWGSNDSLASSVSDDQKSVDSGPMAKSGQLNTGIPSRPSRRSKSHSESSDVSENSTTTLPKVFKDEGKKMSDPKKTGNVPNLPDVKKDSSKSNITEEILDKSISPQVRRSSLRSSKIDLSTTPCSNDLTMDVSDIPLPSNQPPSRRSSPRCAKNKFTESNSVSSFSSPVKEPKLNDTILKNETTTNKKESTSPKDKAKDILCKNMSNPSKITYLSEDSKPALLEKELSEHDNKTSFSDVSLPDTATPFKANEIDENQSERRSLRILCRLQSSLSPSRPSCSYTAASNDLKPLDNEKAKPEFTQSDVGIDKDLHSKCDNVIPELPVSDNDSISKGPAEKEDDVKPLKEETTSDGDKKKSIGIVEKFFSGKKIFKAIFGSEDSSSSVNPERSRSTELSIDSSDIIEVEIHENSVLESRADSNQEFSEIPETNAKASDGKFVRRSLRKYHVKETTPTNNESLARKSNPENHISVNSDSNVETINVISETDDLKNYEVTEITTISVNSFADGFEKDDQSDQEPVSGSAKGVCQSVTLNTTLSSETNEKQEKDKSYPMLSEINTVNQESCVKLSSSIIDTISVSRDLPPPLTELISNQVGKNIPEELIISPIDKLVVATELTELIVSPVEAVVHSNNDDISVSGSLKLLAESACHMKKAEINKSIQSEANGDQILSDDVSDSKDSNVQWEILVDAGVETAISTSSESVKNEDNISSQVESLNISNDPDHPDSANLLQLPVKETLNSDSVNADSRDALTTQPIVEGSTTSVGYINSVKEDIKKTVVDDPSLKIDTKSKPSDFLVEADAVASLEGLDESCVVCVDQFDEIKPKHSDKETERLIVVEMETDSSKSVSTANSNIALLEADPCKPEEPMEANPSGPLYEAIIANTNDYALVSPASDTIIISHDATPHLDNAVRNVEGVSVVPIDCSIQRSLKTQFSSFDAQSSVDPTISQQTISEQNFTMTEGRDGVQTVQSSDNTANISAAEFLASVKSSNEEREHLIKAEFQQSDVVGDVQDVLSCCPINSVEDLKENFIGKAEGKTQSSANISPTDVPLILLSPSTMVTNVNESISIAVEQSPCKDDSDKVGIAESHAIVHQNVVDLKGYDEKERDVIVEPIIESFVGGKSDYELVLISDVALQIPIEKESEVTNPEELTPSEVVSQRLPVLNSDSESDSSIIPLDKDNSKDFNIELTDTDIDSLAQLQSGVDKQFYKDNICQAASSESILNKDLLDSQNQSDTIGQIETIIAPSDPISPEIPFDYGTNSVSSCLVDERSINIPETDFHDPMSNVTLEIEDNPVVDLSDDVNNLKDDELSDYLSARNLERVDSDKATQLSKSNDIIHDILLDWSGDECDSSHIVEQDESDTKSQQDQLLNVSNISSSEITKEDVHQLPNYKTALPNHETKSADFNFIQDKDPVGSIKPVNSPISSDDNTVANHECNIKSLDDLSISNISSMQDLEKHESTETITAESGIPVTESEVFSANQSSDLLEASVVAVNENKVTTENVEGISNENASLKLIDSNIVSHDAIESITDSVLPEFSCEVNLTSDKIIKSPLVSPDIDPIDISAPLNHATESLPQGIQTLENINISVCKEPYVGQLAETDSHSLTDSSGEKDLSFTEESCVEQELVITDECTQQEFKDEIKLNEEGAGGKSDVVYKETDMILSSSSLDSGDTNLQTEAVSSSDNASDQTLVTVSSVNSPDDSNENVSSCHIQSPDIAAEDEPFCVEEVPVTTVESISKVNPCKGEAQVDKDIADYKIVRLESEVNFNNENKDILEIVSPKSAEIMSSNNVLGDESKLDLGNRPLIKLGIESDDKLRTVDCIMTEGVGTKEARLNMSPESSASEALPISPLSVTVYNSSDDTDASPVAKVNLYPSIKYSINSSHRTVESHVDVTVVNPEEPVESIPTSVSKSSPIDIVVVSPSGDVVSSPNDSSTVINVDEKLKEKSTEHGLEISSKSEESNVSTQEEILNELMSSVVSSKSFKDGSESESSPKPDTESFNDAALLSPSPLGSPYSSGSPRSMEFSNSTEKANYRKRTYKAVPETDFVKKCKWNKNSGNIVIHSSEDESPQDKKTTIRRKSIGKEINTPKQSSKHIERKESKISNPYSKVFYLNRSNKNKDDSEFSFKTLFSSRRNSCIRSSTPAKVDDSQDDLSVPTTEVSKPTGLNDPVISDLSADIEVQQIASQAPIENSILQLGKSDNRSEKITVSKSSVAALPLGGVSNESKPSTSRSRSISFSFNHVSVSPFIRSKSLENLCFTLKEPVPSDSVEIGVESLINEDTITPDSDTYSLPSLPLKDVRVVLKKIEATQLSKFSLDNVQDYLSGSNGTTESGGVNDLQDNIAEFRNDDNSSSSLNKNNKESSGKDKTNAQGSRPPNSSRPASPANVSVNSKTPLIKLGKLNMGNLSSFMKDNGLKNVNVPAFFLHLKDDKTLLKGFKPNKSLNWFLDISDEGNCFKVISDHNNTCEVVYIKAKNIHHRHLNIDNCECPFSKRLYSKFTGWESLKEDLGRCNSDKPSAPKPPPVPKKIHERKEREIKRKRGRHRLTVVKPKPVWNPPSDIELQRKRMREIEMAAGAGSSQTLRESASAKQSGKLNAPSEHVVVGRVKSLETQEPNAYIPIPSHRQQQLKRPDARYTPDVPSLSFDPVYPYEFPIRFKSSFPRLRDVELDISSVKGLMKARKGELSSGREAEQIMSFDAPLTPDQCLITDSIASPQIDETFSVSNELAGCPLLNYNDFISERSLETSHSSLNRLTTNPVSGRQSDKRKLESTRDSTKRLRPEGEGVRWVSTSNSTTEVKAVGSQSVGSVRLKDESLLLRDKPESSSFSHRDRRPKTLSKRRELFLKQQEKMKQQWTGLRQLSLTRLIETSLDSSQPKKIDPTVNMDLVQEYEGNRVLCLITEGVMKCQPAVEVTAHNKISKPLHEVWIRKKSNEEKQLVVGCLQRSYHRQPVFTTSPSCKSDQGNKTIAESGDVEMRDDCGSGDKGNLEADPVSSEQDPDQDPLSPQDNLDQDPLSPEQDLDLYPQSPDSISSELSDSTQQPYLRHNWSHWPPGPLDVFDPRTVDQESPAAMSPEPEDTAVPGHPPTFPPHI